MKLDEIIAGATCSIYGTGGPTGLHMHVIVANPCEKGDVLCVPWCTYRGQSDKSCILEVRSHELITVQSVMFYGFCRKKSVKSLVDGQPAITKPVSKAILERVCAGLLVSDHTPPWAREYAIREWAKVKK